MKDIMDIIKEKQEQAIYAGLPLSLTSKQVDEFIQYSKNEYLKGFSDGSEIKEKKSVSFNIGICFLKKSEAEKHPIAILRNNPLLDITVTAECLNIVNDNMGLWDRIKTTFHFFKTLKQYLTT